jgi:hypothetical protein
LWEGDRVVAPKALEARETDFFSPFFHPTKKGLKRQMDAHLNILKHLGMNQLHGWAICFPNGQERLGIVQAKWSTCLVGFFPKFNRLIIDKAAFLKLSLKDTPLAVGQVDSVLEGFSHRGSIHDFTQQSSLCNLSSKAAKATGKGLYPGALWASEAPGRYALEL